MNSISEWFSQWLKIEVERASLIRTTIIRFTLAALCIIMAANHYYVDALVLFIVLLAWNGEPL